jgi:hypothetical protein
MTLKQKIEDHAVIIFGGALILGFISGIAAFDRVISMTSKAILPADLPVTIKNLTAELDMLKNERAAVNVRLIKSQEELSAFKTRPQPVPRTIDSADASTNLTPSSNSMITNTAINQANEKLIPNQQIQRLGEIEISLSKVERTAEGLVIYFRGLNRGNDDQSLMLLGRENYLGVTQFFANGKVFNATNIMVGNKEEQTTLSTNFIPSSLSDLAKKFI